MRPAFVKALTEISETEPGLMILTADLGFKLFDDFRARWPERFFDVGVAETSMIGLAAGLALSRKIVYCYSIVPFLVMRAFEHIRNDIAYQNLNVKLIGVGGGFTYGLEGISHFGLEDIALMTMLPHMTVICPADPVEARIFAQMSVTTNGPMYFRLGKSGDPVIHKTPPDLHIGQAVILAEGQDAALIATGSMVLTGIRVVEILKQRGLSLTLIDMHTIKPLDAKTIIKIARTHKAIFTLEEHSLMGGLGCAVADILARIRYNGFLKKIGIPEILTKAVGCTDYLRAHYGLDPISVSDTIFKDLGSP